VALPRPGHRRIDRILLLGVLPVGILFIGVLLVGIPFIGVLLVRSLAGVGLLVVLLAVRLRRRLAVVFAAAVVAEDPVDRRAAAGEQQGEDRAQDDDEPAGRGRRSNVLVIDHDTDERLRLRQARRRRAPRRRAECRGRSAGDGQDALARRALDTLAREFFFDRVGFPAGT
jgi:hypothetical protein